MILSLLRPLWWMKVKVINMLSDLKGFIKVFNIHFQTIALFLSERQVALLTRFFSGCSGNTAGESFANGNIPLFILHDFSLFLSSYCFIHSFSLSSILTLLAMQLKGTMMNCSKRFDKTYILCISFVILFVGFGCLHLNAMQENHTIVLLLSLSLSCNLQQANK